MRFSLAIFGLGLAAILVATRLRPAPVVSEPEPVPVAQEAAQPAAVVAPAVAAPDEFGAWLRQEARRLDASGGEDQEKQMAEVAARLTPAQTRDLLRTAKSVDAPAGEQILSTYLLVQAGPRALGELRELIASPLSANGPAHSDAELKHARDKTLRLMALDGLSAQSKKDPTARAALARAVKEIEDPFLKAQARERLEAL